LAIRNRYQPAILPVGGGAAFQRERDVIAADFGDLAKEWGALSLRSRSRDAALRRSRHRLRVRRVISRPLSLRLRRPALFFLPGLPKLGILRRQESALARKGAIRDFRLKDRAAAAPRLRRSESRFY